MLTLRPMKNSDLPAVAGIEGENPSPWPLSALAEELQVRHGQRLVAVTPDARILGWCACRTIWPEAELLKIAVAQDRRHQGIGTALLSALVRELEGQAYSTLFLEVRSRNGTALRFYTKHGFRQVGLRSGYYADPDDDAIILQKDLEADQSEDLSS